MKRVLLSLLSATALAQEPAAPATPPAPADPNAPAAPEVKVEPYQVKSRSKFDITPEARPPFWPIGWQRRSAEVVAVKKGEAPVVVKAPTLLPEYFTVTSVLLGSPALATINGRSFAEGEFIPIVFDGRPVRLLLRAVRDGGVHLEADQQSFFVPLRRAEIPRNSTPTPQELTPSSPMIIQSGPKKK